MNLTDHTTPFSGCLPTNSVESSPVIQVLTETRQKLLVLLIWAAREYVYTPAESIPVESIRVDSSRTVFPNYGSGCRVLHFPQWGLVTGLEVCYFGLRNEFINVISFS